jgi:prolyl-tRNA synthetase
MHEPRVAETAEAIYKNLSDNNIDVIMDDRDERAGVKFNDADLIGIPVRVTVGLRGVKEGLVEMRLRTESESVNVPIKDAPAIIREKVKNLYDSLE